MVKRTMDYIWENYGDSSLSIKELADHVYLTPTYLSNLFKKSTGLTIGQYLVDVRIRKAKWLMKEPKLKFYQIASMVGYEDSNYFAKIFKKKTNMTPSEYKESLSVR
ncbi:MAG: helix-turn-helix transcriptional regulator [Lachnospiraceae bacterium]|nr:helix-turn-helix transcriptional regulator [Lachnospiraceae bacterium]